jgi:hypothetical protein
VRRRQGCSPVVGRREAEQEESLISGGSYGMEDAMVRGRVGGEGSGGRHGLNQS